jgi:hypothetical protein
VRERPLQYILDERGEPQPTDDLELYARWFEADERRVVRKQTFVLGHPELVSEPVEVTVSTVFLGLDHSWDAGPPVLWETMVFGLPGDEEICERYTSREAAIAGHNRIVAELGGPVVEG